MTTRLSTFKKQLALAILLAGVATPVQAANITWDGSTDSDWNTGSNWVGDVPPGAIDNAYINLPAGPLIESAIAPINQLYVGNSLLGSLTIGNAGSLTADGQITIGNNNGSNGTVSLFGGGSLTSNNMISIANNTGSNAIVSVTDAGSTLSSAFGINIGNLGAAIFNVSNGGLVTSNGAITVGAQSSATISGAGSVLSNTDVGTGIYASGNLIAEDNASITAQGAIGVGNSGNGTLDVNTGASAHADGTVTIGINNGFSGTATIDGAGSTLTSGGAMTIGDASGSTGILTVQNDADVTSTGILTLGRLLNSSGTATVTGAGSTLDTDWRMDIGIGGTGTLNIENGASSTSASEITLGYDAGGIGSANVRDNGSSLNGMLLFVGRSGNGTLAIENGGDAVMSNSIFVGSLNGSTGNVTVTGAGSTLAGGNQLRVGDSGTGTLTIADTASVTNASAIYVGSSNTGDGTVNITSGGSLSNSSSLFYIADDNGSTGEVNVSGAGSTLTTAGDIRVGINGNGTLNVEDGATANITTDIYAGFGASGVGNINVRGAGSTLQTTDAFRQFVLGVNGDSFTTIENGGAMTSSGGITMGSTANGDATVTVRDNGSSFSSSFDLYVGSNGSGTINIENGGDVTVAADTYLGANVGSTGTLNIDGNGSLLNSNNFIHIGHGGNGTATITNAGGMTSSNDIVIGGLASGVGDVNIDGVGSNLYSSTGLTIGDAGTGTLTLSSGGTTFVTTAISVAAAGGSTGTLNIGAADGDAAAAAGFVSTTALNFGAGTGTIVFNHTNNSYTFATAISGNGTLDMLAGSTNLLGNSAGFTGLIDAQGGMTYVNGDFSAGNSIVRSGARLGGSGYINDLTLNNGSMIAPGNSIGTLNVTGNYIHNIGAIYEVEVADDGTSDLINVTGNANLLGGIVSVTPLPGTYAQDTDYTILTAAGGVTGTFDTATSINALFDAALSYDPNNVYLRMTRNDQSFADVAGTIGAAFDAVPDADPAKQLLLGSSDAVIVQSLNNVAIAPYPSEAVAAPQITDKIRTAIANRIDLLWARNDTQPDGTTNFAANNDSDLNTIEPAAGFMLSDAFSRDASARDRLALDQFGGSWTPSAAGWGGWVQGYGVTGRMEQGGRKLAYDYAGLAAGLDREITPDLLGGFALSYARGFSEARPGDSDATTDMYQVAGYLAWQHDGWRAQGTAGYSLGDTDAKRTILFGGLPLDLTADYQTDILHAAFEGGHAFAFDGAQTYTSFEIMPLAGATYSMQRQEAFTEQGSGAGLSLRENTTHSFKPSIGVRASGSIEQPEGARIVPSLTLRLRHELGDTSADTNGSFAGAGGVGPVFSVGSIERARTEANVEAGVIYQQPSGASYYANYGTTQSATTSEHEMLVGVKWKW